jgi:hypothetical protein
MGYLEGIDSERGIACRVSDSLSLRAFLGVSLEEQKPEHSTLSKTRRLMSLRMYKAVFRWALKRRRGELVEKSFAHMYDTGGMRRVHLRGRDNIAKRALIHAAAFNLILILRRILRVGTVRQVADLPCHHESPSRRKATLSTGC